LNTFSASINGHVADINAWSASQAAKDSTLATYTASLNANILRIQESTASLNAFTQSAPTTYEGRASATKVLVSGSSQIDATATTNWSTGIKTQLNTNTVISGSSQLTSSYDTRYVISGSITQTTWDNIANKPSGIVSGSSQVDITATTGYTSFSSSIASQFAIIDGGTY
jgi:hypothetical protein